MAMVTFAQSQLTDTGSAAQCITHFQEEVSSQATLSAHYQQLLSCSEEHWMQR